MTVSVDNCRVSRILTNGGSSSDVKYTSVLWRICPSKEEIWPHKGRILNVFNDFNTRPYGTKEFPISIGEGMNKRCVKMHFLMALCESVYNCI